MIRPVLTELALFLAPFALYALVSVWRPSAASLHAERLAAEACWRRSPSSRSF